MGPVILQRGGKLWLHAGHEHVYLPSCPASPQNRKPCSLGAKSHALWRRHPPLRPLALPSPPPGWSPARLCPTSTPPPSPPRRPLAQVTEGGRSFSSFLTGLCAIVGGVFTVAGMCDACIFRLTRHEGSRAK